MDQDLLIAKVGTALASLYSASVTQSGMLLKLVTATIQDPSASPTMKKAAQAAFEDMDDMFKAFDQFQETFEEYRTLLEEVMRRGGHDE